MKESLMRAVVYFLISGGGYALAYWHNRGLAWIGTGLALLGYLCLIFWFEEKQ